MNEDNVSQRVNVAFQPGRISPGAKRFSTARVLNGETVALNNNTASVTVSARGLVVLAVDGLNIDLPVHQNFPKPGPLAAPAVVKVDSGKKFDVRAVSIQIEPGDWDAYVWATAGFGKLKEINMDWRAGEKRGTLRDVEYPYEFSLPVQAGTAELQFRVYGVTADGASFEVKEQKIGVHRN